MGVGHEKQNCSDERRGDFRLVKDCNLYKLNYLYTYMFERIYAKRVRGDVVRCDVCECVVCTALNTAVKWQTKHLLASEFEP